MNWETAETEPNSLKPLTKLSLTASPGAPIKPTPVEELSRASPPLTETYSPIPLQSVSEVQESVSPREQTSAPQPSSVMTVYKSSTCDIAQLKQELNLMTVVPTSVDVERPVVFDESEDEEDFCVTGKFAQFNATFDSLPSDGVERIDAAISKVDHLLNESSTEPLNTTYDRPVLNKTYEKTGDSKGKTGDMNTTFDADQRNENLNATFDAEKNVVMNKTFDAENGTDVMNKTYDAQKTGDAAMNKTFEVSEPSVKSPAVACSASSDGKPVVASSTKASPMREPVDLSTTYQLSTPLVAVSGKPGADTAKAPPKPKTYSGPKNPRVVANPKRPLQENNFPKPKTVTQGESLS